jgi:hypothetical protein
VLLFVHPEVYVHEFAGHHQVAEVKRGPWKHLALQTRLTIALGGSQEYLLGQRELDNGNSG